MSAIQKKNSLRIGVVQFRPKIGEVQANIAKARELCRNLEPHSIDILCFPEMVFTGYVFESADAISPYLEDPQTGPTSKFCRELAQRLNCYVAAGYPERLGPNETDTHSEVHNVNILSGEMEITPEKREVPSAAKEESQVQAKVGANSAILYGPGGNWVGGYRKTNLFYTDMTWAKPGTGFTTFSFTLPASSPTIPPSDVAPPAPAPQSINVTFAICMDLNPHPPILWTSDKGPYELADYCTESNTNLLILLNAWLDSGHQDEDGIDEVAEDDGENNHDWQTLRYWTARLQPLWKRDGRRRGSMDTIYSGSSGGSGEVQGGEEAVEDAEEEKPEHETIVVVCNRTGEENGQTFAGSSAIFSMRAGSGRAKLLDMLSRREESVRVWNLLI